MLALIGYGIALYFSVVCIIFVGGVIAECTEAVLCDVGEKICGIFERKPKPVSKDISFPSNYEEYAEQVENEHAEVEEIKRNLRAGISNYRERMDRIREEAV